MQPVKGARRYCGGRPILWPGLWLFAILLLAACVSPAAPSAGDADSGQSSTPVTAVATSAAPEARAGGAAQADAVGDPPAGCSGLPTTANQEGPYYSPGSPQKSNLIEEGMVGTSLLLVGRVFDLSCAPVVGAKLDFWQADFGGEYDNVGFRLRGHVITDEDGGYALETIEPGPYTGRPPHIHVKLFAPDGRELLTSQIYTSGSEASPDVRAAPDLLATYVETDEAGRQQVLFNVVVDVE